MKKKMFEKIEGSQDNELMMDKDQKQEKLPENKADNKVDKLSLVKDDIQYNSQDLDQKQSMDLNPVQTNTQKLYITLNDIKDYSGKITGVAYIEKSGQIAENAAVFLFFGNERKNPVCKTYSDRCGNFAIAEIPPGYYTLYAMLGNYLKFEAYSIKVMPCQNVFQSVLLK